MRPIPKKKPIELKDFYKLVTESKEFENNTNILKTLKEKLKLKREELEKIKDEVFLIDDAGIRDASNIQREYDIIAGAYDKRKNNTSYITPAGIFTYRKDESFVEDSYSNIIPIDIDINFEKKENIDIDIPTLRKKSRKISICCNDHDKYFWKRSQNFYPYSSQLI